MTSEKPLVRAKVVLAGQPGVGKTSLTRRFVSDEFSEHHIETIGVRVEKRTIELATHQVELMVWDVAGVEDTAPLQSAYLRGAMGMIYVADQTNLSSVERLTALGATALEIAPDHLQIAVLNKIDLPADGSAIEAFADLGISHKVHTSARTGEGVEEAFSVLAENAITRVQSV